ncbi:MAG: cation diffusion facilitator family transporter [archaeon]
MNATKKTVYAALLGNLAIALFKFIAALVTRSSAMLAEAYHSLSDTANQIFLLIGIKLSKREATQLHPFGHAREQYFWSFVVAVILFGVAGTLSIREGYSSLLHPETIKNVYWSYAAILVGFIFDGYALRLAHKQMKKLQKEEHYDNLFLTIKHSKNPTVLTVFMEDSLAIIGLGIAAVSITLTYITGNHIYDAIGSIIIGVLLMIFALMLGYEVKKLIIGESISYRKKRKIRAIVESFDEVQKVFTLKTMHLSDEVVIIGLEIKYNGNLRIRQVEKINDQIEARVKEIIPQAKCFIEPENKAMD